MNGINSLLRPDQMPVEQMSNQNAIGANTGYPQAALPQTGYSPGSAMPAGMNVLQGDQDVRVDPYTGEEKFARGGIARYEGGGLSRSAGLASVAQPTSMSDRILQSLMTGSEIPSMRQAMPTAVGQQLYDTAGTALPRYQLNPDGTFSLAGTQEAAQQALGPKYVTPQASSGSAASYMNNSENRAPLPRTPAMFGGVEKPWNEWTEGEKAQWRRENPGLAAFDSALHKVVDPAAEFIGGGGFTGALFKGLGLGSLLNAGQSSDYAAAKYQRDLDSLSQLGRMEAQAQRDAAAVPIEDRSVPAPEAPKESYADYSARIDAWRAAQEAAQNAGNQSQAETNRLAASIPSSSSGYQGNGGYDTGSAENGLSRIGSWVTTPPSPSGDSDARGGYLSNGKFDQRPSNMAEGGISSLRYNLGSYSDGGRLLKGPGDAMSDSIPATIGYKQPARLADGEFVVPGDVVSHLGNGSTDAGARKLYEMMDKIRKARTGKKRQAPQINPNKFLPK